MVNLRYKVFYIDSWQNELSETLIDNQVVFSYRYNHSAPGTTQICGHATFKERIIEYN